MKWVNETINKTIYDFTKTHEVIEIVIYSFIGFFLPLMIGHPQIIVGSLVNALIVISALHHKGLRPLSLFILPSIGAITRGILFGPFTIFLIYMAPFIWISNFLIWITIKKLYLMDRKNYLFSLVIASIVKASFLFISAFILYSFGFIPKMFLIAMGPTQLLTAVMGGLIGKSSSELISKIVLTK